MPSALAKTPVFQPPKCLVNPRPPSQRVSSPSHSHPMIQQRLKLAKLYTFVPLLMGQSVMFAWWATVWRQQLLAMEWNMWEVKSLVKPWHPCHYPPGQSRLFQYCPKAKKLTSPCGFAGVRLRGGLWGLWWQIPCNSNIRNVFFLHACCSNTTMSHICSKTKKHAFGCVCRSWLNLWSLSWFTAGLCRGLET